MRLAVLPLSLVLLEVGHVGAASGPTVVAAAVDADRDGFGRDDCDDADPRVNPGAVERWFDGVDQDCDGNDTDRDGRGRPRHRLGRSAPDLLPGRAAGLR